MRRRTWLPAVIAALMLGTSADAAPPRAEMRTFVVDREGRPWRIVDIRCGTEDPSLRSALQKAATASGFTARLDCMSLIDLDGDGVDEVAGSTDFNGNGPAQPRRQMVFRKSGAVWRMVYSAVAPPSGIFQLAAMPREGRAMPNLGAFHHDREARNWIWAMARWDGTAYRPLEPSTVRTRDDEISIHILDSGAPIPPDPEILPQLRGVWSVTRATVVRPEVVRILGDPRKYIGQQIAFEEEAVRWLPAQGAESVGQCYSAKVLALPDSRNAYQVRCRSASWTMTDGPNLWRVGPDMLRLRWDDYVDLTLERRSAPPSLAAAPVAYLGRWTAGSSVAMRVTGGVEFADGWMRTTLGQVRVNLRPVRFPDSMRPAWITPLGLESARLLANGNRWCANPGSPERVRWLVVTVEPNEYGPSPRLVVRPFESATPPARLDSETGLCGEWGYDRAEKGQPLDPAH